MKGEKGQALVLVAVLLVVLVAFLGLVVDLGNAYWQKARLQNAADAAALAGSDALRAGGSSSVIEAAASNIAMRNGATNCEVVVNGLTVKATVHAEVKTFFAGILGIYTIPVSAEAEAKVESVTVLPTTTPGPTPLWTPTPTPTPRVRLTR